MATAYCILELLAYIEIVILLGALEELLHLLGARTLLDQIAVVRLLATPPEQSGYPCAYSMTHS